MLAGAQALGRCRQGCFTKLNQIVGGSSSRSLPAALPLTPSHRRYFAKSILVVCATPNDKDDAATDWDAAWSTFKKGVEAQQTPNRSNVRTKPPT
jgi:hypothetical protein